MDGMPAANPDLAHSNANLRAWLDTHPGFWRPMQIADALGITEHRQRLRVYNALAGLARREEILRHEAPAPPGKRRVIPLYSGLEVRQGGRRT